MTANNFNARDTSIIINHHLIMFIDTRDKTKNMMSNNFTNRNHEEVDCTKLKRIKHTNLKQSVPSKK